MHELKNPLSVIDMSMSVQRVTGQSLDTDASVSRAISDIKSIIDRCIEFDQLDATLSVAKKDRINLSQLVLQLMNHEANKEVKWLGQIQPELWVVADAHYLNVVLNNLMDNARKYKAPESVVQVSVPPL
jgi:signal transduction histidine kinase